MQTIKRIQEVSIDQIFSWILNYFFPFAVDIFLVSFLNCAIFLKFTDILVDFSIFYPWLHIFINIYAYFNILNIYFWKVIIVETRSEFKMLNVLKDNTVNLFLNDDELHYLVNNKMVYIYTKVIWTIISSFFIHTCLHVYQKNKPQKEQK